jgi:hypothetical protein
MENHGHVAAAAINQVLANKSNYSLKDGLNTKK